jgi:predicted transcriptional regulator
MSSSRRSKFEIWSEILEFCLRKKRSQTWLLRNTRLNTNAIKENLQFLLSRNLIDQINEGEVIKYHITDKGEDALQKFYTLINDYFDLNQEKRKRKNY